MPIRSELDFVLLSHSEPYRSKPMDARKAKKYLDQLSEFNADPLILLTELDKIRTMCIEGYTTERATPKGVMEVHEKDLRTAVAAIKQTQDLLELMMKTAGTELGDDRDYQFQISVITKPQGE